MAQHVEALTRVREAEARVAEWTAAPDMNAALDYNNEIVALIEGRVAKAAVELADPTPGPTPDGAPGPKSRRRAVRHVGTVRTPCAGARSCRGETGARDTRATGTRALPVRSWR